LTEQKLEFTRQQLILGNLGLLTWVFLSFFSVFFYSQLYGWLYLALLAIVIYVILRRLGCSSCYQCKTCTSGFGRLACAFFGKGFIKKESVGNRIGFVAFIYFLLLPLPVAFLSLSLYASISVFKMFVFVGILAVAAYSLSGWFNRSPKKTNLG
jgi:hypothetical protein